MTKVALISKYSTQTTMEFVKLITVANCPTQKKIVMTIYITMVKMMNKMCQGYYKCVGGDERCPNSIILYETGKVNYCCKLENPKEDCEYYDFYNEDEIVD